MLIGRRFNSLIIIFVSIINCQKSNAKQRNNPYPIVLWHGVGDYYNNNLMNSFKTFLETHIKNVNVTSLRIGNTGNEDLKNSYLMDINIQINIACKIISSNPILKNGYHAIGFSQGAQFFRGVIQRCPEPPVINFISLGGQHQGVYGVPHCPTETSPFCDLTRKMINQVVYTEMMQKHSVQAQYWHNPLNEDEYRKKSTYLAEINNEVNINETYKTNLLKLKNFVLVKFAKDTIVNPIESEWFGFYKAGQGTSTETLPESTLYIEDKLGLKQLNKSNRLYFLTMSVDHMHLDWDWLLTNIIYKFLLNKI